MSVIYLIIIVIAVLALITASICRRARAEAVDSVACYSRSAASARPAPDF
ncbi:MAG: hypothetical protein KA419_20490 [Acidobacteria bacterium]|nr:hypothetical protein [Acidobacteriota bacterium]